jgi:alkanesulfonate monooxygenase SsuD/methylene tetrahydromethanopterin reductase-like flavin-dependent oxidoreductase (luciferase family)
MVLHLALEIDGAGAHPGAATATSVPADRLLSADHLRRTVAAAENAGVTFVTFDDALIGPARVDAVTRAAFVAPLTSRIGLVPLAHPGVTEPFHLASQVAALDHAATGRSGWLVGSGTVPGARAALDRPVADGQDLLDETADVVRVVRDLWDSWDDDAVIRDTATGRYIDRDRLHYVDFTSGGSGPFAGPALRDAPDGARAPFTVKGPLIVPRGPQGQPVVVARAGTVPLDLVDIALVDTPEASGAPRTFLDLHVTLDTADASAADRLAALEDVTPSADVLRWTGSADGLVELLLSLRGAVDGVRLLPSLLEEDLPQLVRWVLPALRVARATPTPRPGATLRDTLGLPRPTSRFATLQETS